MASQRPGSRACHPFGRVTTNKQVMVVLGDPTRLDLLNRLASDGPASASALASDLPISRQAIAKHLRLLEDAGLLERRRSGRQVEYVFEPGPLADVVAWVDQIGSKWDERLNRLKEAVD